MWTCPQCGTHVEPPLTVCRQCGTAQVDVAPPPADDAAPELPAAPAIPDETVLTRMLRGAKVGALCGAFMGAVFATGFWVLLSSLGAAIPAEAWYREFPLAVLQLAAVFGVLMAAYGVLVGLLPRRKRRGAESSAKPRG